MPRAYAVLLDWRRLSRPVPFSSGKDYELAMAKVVFEVLLSLLV